MASINDRLLISAFITEVIPEEDNMVTAKCSVAFLFGWMWLGLLLLNLNILAVWLFHKWCIYGGWWLRSCAVAFRKCRWCTWYLLFRFRLWTASVPFQRGSSAWFTKRYAVSLCVAALLAVTSPTVWLCVCVCVCVCLQEVIHLWNFTKWHTQIHS